MTLNIVFTDGSSSFVPKIKKVKFGKDSLEYDTDNKISKLNHFKVNADSVVEVEIMETEKEN